MKIEKVNDNQIRCTLTREDLDDRHLKLSELAYGTEKAKSLFRDMMQQASYEFGFEAEDIPLMIEAIPLSADTIILIITKVEYPEELDTRFSKFSEADSDLDHTEDLFAEDEDSSPEGADDILDLFRKIQEDKLKSSKIEKELQKSTDFIPLDQALATQKTDDDTVADKDDAPEVSVVVNITKLFVFDHFEELSRLSRVVYGFYDEDNSLYKNRLSSRYYLVINKGHHTPEDFNKLCNILSEYAKQEKYTNSTEAYFQEHYVTVIPDNALQVIASL